METSHRSIHICIQNRPEKGASVGGHNASTSEFLTFQMGDDEYALDALFVQETRSYVASARSAHLTEFIDGVLSLRDVIVPVVDLRIKLSGASVKCNDFTAVIVLNVHGRVVGVVVDSVSDVMELSQDFVHPASEMGRAEMDLSLISGVASVGERVLFLLDIEALMSDVDFSQMAATVH